MRTLNLGILAHVDAGKTTLYARLFSGTLRTRDRVLIGRDREGQVTAVSVFDRDGARPGEQVAAGQIGRLWGLAGVRVGDTLGGPGARPALRHFAPPSFETVVVPSTPADKGAVYAALTQLAEQDPLIDLRQDDARRLFARR